MEAATAVALAVALAVAGSEVERAEESEAAPMAAELAAAAASAERTAPSRPRPINTLCYRPGACKGRGSGHAPLHQSSRQNALRNRPGSSAKSTMWAGLFGHARQ